MDQELDKDQEAEGRNKLVVSKVAGWKTWDPSSTCTRTSGTTFHK